MIRIAIITALLLPSAASAQTKQFYGADGEYLGQSMPSGPNVTQYYGSDGSPAATTMRAGRNTFVYGPDGSFAGTIMNSGRTPEE